MCCCRWQLLTASEDGTLRLLQLACDGAVQAQTADLPPSCELMALSEPFNRLGVVRSATPHQPAVLECIELDAFFRQSSVVLGEDSAPLLCIEIAQNANCGKSEVTCAMPGEDSAAALL